MKHFFSYAQYMRYYTLKESSVIFTDLFLSTLKWLWYTYSLSITLKEEK